LYNLDETVGSKLVDLLLAKLGQLSRAAKTATTETPVVEVSMSPTITA
jgi:hypothetical protein